MLLAGCHVIVVVFSTTMQGPLVYVNYGRMSDFLYLTNSSDLHLNLSGYICIARYGEIFRGDKVMCTCIPKTN